MNLLRYYLHGDWLGSNREGSAGDISPGKPRHNTDESDIIDCFLHYCYGPGQEHQHSPKDYALHWYQYHERMAGYFRYGETWKDHFQVMRSIIRDDYDAIVRVSRSRNSKGNGALVLSYPFARVFGSDCSRFVFANTAGTHSAALFEAIALADYFAGNVSERKLAYAASNISTSLAGGCLYYALIISKEPTYRSVIKKAFALGGDVDSYLSLGLLIHTHRKRSQPC